jgi:hypothetical protein
MREILLRLNLLILTCIYTIQSYAQDFDGDSGDKFIKKGDELELMEGMEGMEGYQPFHLSFVQILLILLLIACCYIFGKIWRGCTYLIILLAVFFYFMSR